MSIHLTGSERPSDRRFPRKAWGEFTPILLIATLSMGLSGGTQAQDTDVSFQNVQNAMESARLNVLATMDKVNDNVLCGEETSIATDGDQAEGFRYVLRRIEHQLQGSKMDDVDPLHPRIYRGPSKISKLGFDSPHFVYQAAGPLSPSYEYRVFGQLDTTIGVDFMTFQMFVGLGGNEVMTSDDLILDVDGNWEIILTGDPGYAAANPGVNSLLITQELQNLVIRQYHTLWDQQESSLEIEVLSSPITPVEPLTPAKAATPGAPGTATGLERLVYDIDLIPFLLVGLQFPDGDCATATPGSGWPMNDVPAPTANGFGLPGAGFPGQYAAAARYYLPEGQAMIITVDNTATRYHDIQLGNLWLESLDYGSRSVSWTREEAFIDADDKIRYVLSHTDPGAHNWLDITGHARGGLFMRFTLPDLGDLPTKPSLWIGPVEDVAAQMPVGHLTVTPMQRSADILYRERSFNRRINPDTLVVDNTVDSDGDGYANTYDSCEGTTSGAAVDNSGCSKAQACESLGYVLGQGWTPILSCVWLDWRNNWLPLVNSNSAEDCAIESGYCVEAP